MKDIEERLNLLLQENRLATFNKWVFGDDDVCSAKKMAEAGFYFIGGKREPDSVQCFLCGKCLDGWEPDDDPFREHLKHSPACSFAKLMTPEDALTYFQFLDIRAELIKKLMNEKMDAEFEKVKTQFEEAKRMVTAHLRKVASG